MAARRRYFPGDSDEEDPLYSTTNEEENVQKWNRFTNTPREPSVGSSVETKFYDFSVKSMKIITYFIVFVVVLGSAILSKATTLFMTSQIKKNVTRPYCNKNIDTTEQFIVTIPTVERVAWIWMLIFAYCVPEIATFARSLRKCLFKKWDMPTFWDFLSLLITEICPAIGSAILIFLVFPELDVIKAAMLTNAVCFIPGFIAFCSRRASLDSGLLLILDVLSTLAQASSFVIWPLVEQRPILYAIPVAVILISFGWWENFVSKDSPIEFISQLGQMKRNFQNQTYFLYIFVSLIKCLVFFSTTLVIFWCREGDVNFLFKYFVGAFEDHHIYVAEIEPIISSDITPNYDNAIRTGDGTYITTDYMTPIWVFLVNILTTYICYAFGKFACKVMIQEFSYALPVNLSVPVLLTGLIAMCGSYSRNECVYADTIPEYLFFIPPPLYYLNDFILQKHCWVWLLWLLSQAWITVYIWQPNPEKLATTEKLFIRPMYDAFLIDQSLAMNRRRDEDKPIIREEANEIRELREADLDDSKVVRIFACATMWHETEDEMMEFLKSIFRLDQDQCANRIVRNYLQYNLPTYYEFETHVLFDDAFIRKHEKDQDPHLNQYVLKLISTMDKAATKVHGTEVTIRPPKIFPTPYGGRLVWTLPGKTKLIAHLKDSMKIRKKKRWSQVMYMYYLLGHRLADNNNIPDDKKDLVAENTFLLALDGDIDFQPEAVHLLVDYMKKNRRLGAACGRIHPIGSGVMVWYQMFEYAVGHWLQKATEHVAGCVLCSPGCFSLFRGKALIQDAVMKKYTTRSTQAAHYVQYDQGEDRWLCTLLLQQGYRVEYSAASDAYTQCPEGFNEFYNQRRRWMPSTMANILDLLMDSKHTIEMNENISSLYIAYQLLLLVGTVLGPGTIFLMLVGAFNVAFGLNQWTCLLWNLLPILIFIIVCATCSSEIQLFFAGLISSIYGLIMMAVFVGIMLQMQQDGVLAPSSLFFFCVAGEMIIAALMHPKEFYCLKYGIIYYVTVPSMYMLLVIYSVFNMNCVSWGTRDVTIVPDEKPEETENKDKPKEDDKKKTKKDVVLSYLGASPDDSQGSIEFSLNKLFKCMFCTYRADDKENEQLKKIQETLNQLTKKLDYLENVKLEEKKQQQPKPIVLEGSLSNNSDGVMENSWFYDGDLIRGETDFLSVKEETFWKEFIKAYLQPIEDDKTVAKDLKDLRDKMVFAFLMLNSLFVLVVFLLTLQKDILHLNWPVDPTINFTYYSKNNEFLVTRTYLQLEPIGFVFLLFFGVIMVIQGIGMCVHRFATFSQIIANTRLNLNLFKKSVENMTEDEIKSRNPLKLVKELQKLKGINDIYELEQNQPIEERKTLSNLAQQHGRKSTRINDLEKAWKARLTGEVEETNPDRRKSIHILNQRRKTIEKSRLQPTFDEANETEDSVV